MIKGRVLLLNQSFEVLGTIGVAMAIRMTLREENPVIVHEYVPDTYLTSAGGEKFPVPSVVSLKHYINITKRRQESGAKRLKIYIRDGYKCQYCGTKVGKKHPVTKKVMEIKDLTLDHLLPKSRGGKNIPENLVTACKSCNQRKGDRLPEEARMPLLTEIHSTVDIGLDKILICKYAESRTEWLPYLQGLEDFKPYLEKMVS